MGLSLEVEVSVGASSRRNDAEPFCALKGSTIASGVQGFSAARGAASSSSVSVREVFAPAARDEFGDVGADDELVGVARLHARVDDDGRGVCDVVAAQLRGGGVYVG